MNMGKIVNKKWMKISVLNRAERTQVQTIQDFSDSMGILRAAEKCNGSGIAGNRPQLVEVCVQVIERR
jgi:hypothetical protein